MANLYFASKADTDGAVIFIDEGFFHRGVSFFFQKKTPKKFQKYLDGTPPCDVLVVFETPAETAFERCLNRGRTPEVYAGKSNAETLNNFAKLQIMQDICKEHQIASGGKVITIDATQPVENSAEILCCELQNLAQQYNFLVRKEECA